jgi:hypothetical protein
MPDAITHADRLFTANYCERLLLLCWERHCPHCRRGLIYHQEDIWTIGECPVCFFTSKVNYPSGGYNAIARL